MATEELMQIDRLMLALLAIAAFRGAYLGVYRAFLSLSVILAALLAVVWIVEPLRETIEKVVRLDRLGPEMLIIAGGIFFATLVLLFVLGQVLQSGGHLPRPTPIGRVLGLGIGGVEGVVFVFIIILVDVNVMGREDPSVHGSSSLAATDAAHELIEDELGSLPSWMSPSSLRAKRLSRGR